MLYSVILPTYNERENLPIIFYLLHKTFSQTKDKLEIIIVDDSSPDGTLSVAESLKSSSFCGKDSNVSIKILSRKGKLGLGTAYVAGLGISEGERIIIMDADLSHHPKFILKMIEKMDTLGVDIVSGTRYSPGGRFYNQIYFYMFP